MFSNHSKMIVRKQVESVNFGFYTDDDVRCRSVCEVTSPIAMDPLGTALPNGVYDPRLGPSSSESASSLSPCITCSQPYSSCPGHYGHIELCVPLYHPLLFSKVVELLRMKCLHCHKLTAPTRTLNVYKTKFLLLQRGRYKDVQELDDKLAAHMKQARNLGDGDDGYNDDGSDDGDRRRTKKKRSGGSEKALAIHSAGVALDELLAEIQSSLPQDHHTDVDNNNNNNGGTNTTTNNNNNTTTTTTTATAGTTTTPTPTTLFQSSLEEAMGRDLVKEVISYCKGSKFCPHCGAYSPKIRQDMSNKIFQSSLSDTAKRMNAAEGIQIKPALTIATGKKKGRPRGGHDGVDGSDDDDNNDTDDEEEEKEGGNDSDDSIDNRNRNTKNVKDDDDDEDDHDDDDEDGDDDDDDDDEDGATAKVSPLLKKKDKYMHPSEVQAQVLRTWETNPVLCNFLFSVQGPTVFFMQAIPVPPNRFRPPMNLGTMVVEHAQNGFLNKILEANELVRTNFASNNEAMAYKVWIDLQTHLNCYMDNAKDPAGVTQNTPMGIRQLLERKEGIFRKHMMGKRVNFACRSVISPDPYIGTNEIGLPQVFAETLTYPTPVTDINISEMRTLVERGAFNYPGARWVEFPDRRVDLSKMDDHKREAIAARLLTYAKKGGQPAIVGRQLQDGDMVLMNRQPTLHKPGIMAHAVRVLHNPKQKTIRMHYANCNTYNADYDGDEMNCHYPQSDLGRAEAEYIARTDLQFIAPTDGSPLRGLIQDHVVAGVKLTKRDTFLDKWEYQQLLFAALASLPRLEVIRSDSRIEMLPPAIVKPKPLWTGKQVISTLLNHLRKGNDTDTRGPMPGISAERKAKTAGAAFGDAMEEHLVIIRDGELLRGILDKAAYGATEFSLVHAVYEAYGPNKAGLLLNSLGRLFTAYLQFYSGHSCRMEDLILTKESDQTRRRLILKAYNNGSRAAKAWADSEGGKVAIEVDESRGDEPLRPVEMASAAFKVRQLLSGTEGKSNHAALDGFMMSKLNPLASDIVKQCLPSGLAVPFPANTMGIMCGTGAKGSIVNQSQVSCALGQQALEGRRVPRMSSGRTLPSFAPFDVNPRADGFVMDRFLTGIRPQEYYFHCMAGREGLVDTAVKTSRSGYLQRCLVKHLEELKVSYDYTVRNGEGGVVQFLYGEDGLDPIKSCYLDCTDKSFTYMARNYASLMKGRTPLPGATIKVAATDSARNYAVNSNSENPFQAGDTVRARKLRIGSRWERGTLCEGWFEAVILKKGMGNTYDIKYLKDGLTVKNVPVEVEFERSNAVSNICTVLMPAARDPVLSIAVGSHRLGTSGKCVSERIASSASKAMESSEELKKAMQSNKVSKTDFGTLLATKYTSALADPGEAVGAIAAQSIGEPSTQMTLNTFHLAGAGANVTLGIPRLREIIMTASRTLSTPTMSVPLHKNVTDQMAVRLTRSFTKLTLNELIASQQGVTVRETLIKDYGGAWRRAYFVTLKFHRAERIKTAFGLSLDDIAAVVSKAFVPALSFQMKSELRRSSSDYDGDIKVEGGESSNYVGGRRSSRNKNSRDDDDDDFDGNGGDNEGGMSGRNKKKIGADDELEEDDDDDMADDDAGEEDGVMASRTQVETYDEEAEDVEEDGDGGGADSASDDDDDDNDNDAGADDMEDNPTTTSIFNGELSGDSELKLDVKRNMIHLQPLRVDPSARPLLMVGLVEKAAMKILVRSKKNIDQAFINDEPEGGRGRCLQTAGVNFEEIWKLDCVDHSRLMSNDTWAIRCAYGVEAARNNIVDQIRSVFGVYGIEVDPRHLSLIGDYMTYGGDYTPMNRNGMKTTSSPFLQMSFETTAQFLTQAALTAASDDLKSPSANIVVGRPIRHGTGAFSLLVK